MSRPAERTFTPRQIAEGLGVSESSVKRWIDKGHLEAVRTAGGHRRVALREILRYLRIAGGAVVHPGVLGLTGEMKARAGSPTAQELVKLFEEDRAGEAHDLIVSAYLRGESLGDLCDGPLREALHRVGTLWNDRGASATPVQQGIVTEHRATDTVLQALGHIRSLIPAPTNGFGAAVGGALPGDRYLIPTAMVAAVLSDRGMPAVNLGPETPVETLLVAAKRFRASLVWLSCSEADDLEVLRARLFEAAQGARALGARLCVGGRLVDDLATSHPNMHLFWRLEDLVRSLPSPGRT